MVDLINLERKLNNMNPAEAVDYYDQTRANMRRSDKSLHYLTQLDELEARTYTRFDIARKKQIQRDTITGSLALLIAIASLAATTYLIRPNSDYNKVLKSYSQINK